MTYVSPTNSKLLYGTKPEAAADGVTRVAVKARLFDENGKPVANRLVEFLADREGVIIEQPTQPTAADGLAIGFVSAVTPGFVNITALVHPESESGSSSEAAQ
jgi:protocatechuate 3,4-dioxygenase beta subunit